jgi:hypothetical protein
MTTRLSNHVQAFAVAVEERHSQDLAHRLSSAGRIEVPFASAFELRRRVEGLTGALANGMGVREHAAAVGSVCAGIYLVGDEILPDPQLSLLSDQWASERAKNEESPAGEGDDDEEGDGDGESDAGPDEEPRPEPRSTRRRPGK